MCNTHFWTNGVLLWCAAKQNATIVRKNVCVQQNMISPIYETCACSVNIAGFLALNLVKHACINELILSLLG